jgi:hypothetical protein
MRLGALRFTALGGNLILAALVVDMAGCSEDSRLSGGDQVATGGAVASPMAGGQINAGGSPPAIGAAASAAGDPTTEGPGGAPAQGGLPASTETGGVAPSGGSGGAHAGDSGGMHEPPASDAGPIAVATDAAAADPNIANPGNGDRSIVFQLCGAGAAACTNIDRYSQCLETLCATALTACFGEGHAVDDLSGGRCKDYARCVLGSDDPCANDCVPNAECSTCLVDLLACVRTSGCAVGACDAPPDANGDGAPAPVGGCDELDDCCSAIANDFGRNACSEAATAARQQSEQECAAVYAAFHAGALCP